MAWARHSLSDLENVYIGATAQELTRTLVKGLSFVRNEGCGTETVIEMERKVSLALFIKKRLFS